MPSNVPMKSRNVQIRIANFKKIKDILLVKQVKIENDLDQIETYISDEGNAEPILLNPFLEKIAKIVDLFKKDVFDEHMMFGLQQMISICYQLFNDEFQFGSILRQLLRMCGVVISCIWQTHGIDEHFCGLLNITDVNQSEIQTDVRGLHRVALFLHEVERCEILEEKHIKNMFDERRFSNKFSILPNLQDTAKAIHHPGMMVTCLKLSIIQLAVTWQMYAVAKYPGHSDNYAYKYKKRIQSQMTKDSEFIDKFKNNEQNKHKRWSKASDDMSSVYDYVSHLGCDVSMGEPNARKSLKKMFLVIIPHLIRIFQSHSERYTQVNDSN